MLILSNDELLGLLPPSELISAAEAAACASLEHGAQVPIRQHLDWNGNTLLVMPATAADGVAVKVVSIVPGNAARGLPVTNGLMVLNHKDTGLPQALMNAAALTAMRTGAVGALGVKYMTPAEITTLGIIGCGVQGAWQAVFACSLHPIREIFCVPRSAASFHKFTALIKQRAGPVTLTVCADAHELLKRATPGGGLIITATTASRPVLPDEPALLAGKHFISIGSFKPSMQELPDAVFKLAGELVLDSEAARHEVGDARVPVEKHILSETDIFTIGDLISDRRRLKSAATTVYKCAGMALYDLFVARALFQAALRRRVGHEVSL